MAAESAVGVAVGAALAEVAVRAVVVAAAAVKATATAEAAIAAAVGEGDSRCCDRNGSRSGGWRSGNGNFQGVIDTFIESKGVGEQSLRLPSVP